MGWWADLKVRSKIMVLIVCGCIGMAVVAGMGLYGMRHSHESLGDLKENMHHISMLEEMKADFLAMRLDLVYLLSLTDKDKIAERIADYKKKTESIQAGIEKNRALKFNAKEKELADSFASGFQAYLEKGQKLSDMAVQAAEQGRTDRSDVVQYAVTEVAPLYAKPAAAINDLVQYNLKDADTQFTADSSQMRNFAILLGVMLVLVTLGAIVGGGFIAGSINRPLQAVMDAMLKVAAGDLTVRTDIRSRDELGVLSGEVNQMAERLCAAMRSVTQNSEQVAAAAAQLHATAAQIATGAEEVAAQTGTVATASEEMSATSCDIANNCHHAADDSGNANSAASEGALVVEKTVAIMERIAQRVQGTATTISALGARSDQIGEIIGTIEDIADQTNLLALNAAIEAARAGEQGRGFAVVADEVRALAERTTRATREIGEMIKAIQNDTRGAVRAMEEGVLEVENGTVEAGKSGEALRQILSQINNVALQVSQIATAAEEQTATTTEITNNINQISMVVQQTAAGAQETVAAADQLSRLSEQLHGLVGEFRI
ncbi:methyl-accepting chemotaxis protein [Geomesophilobacter sediminis]|uniref:Methyl-accepting chemotaxis protein n=1 Tax=Geomesophilobacter sediminis TaxID=2798584 RepID=A0A8J7LWH5_9BACT|nr:methyl-accepting chemotaxis protein [Geomesophilobacter sediminis]MBJ6725800.1 methyl-accepting chemotaxis protein [Geomesophilobacter sediminis]